MGTQIWDRCCGTERSWENLTLGDLIDLTDDLTIRQQGDTALPSALQELQGLMVHRPPTRDQTTEGCADQRTKQTATAAEETLTASSPYQAIFEALEFSDAAFSARDLYQMHTIAEQPQPEAQPKTALEAEWLAVRQKTMELDRWSAAMQEMDLRPTKGVA